MFEDCINENAIDMKECITDKEDEADMYQKILDFHLRQNKGNFRLPIDIKESSISDDLIVFVFSEEYQTANESDNQNGWFAVIITYDRHDDIFTHYEQEQG